MKTLVFPSAISDGPDEELWRTDDWYPLEVFLSDDEECLVAMGPWNLGEEPRKEVLAVSFYRKGKLLKSNSTVDLVRSSQGRKTGVAGPKRFSTTATSKI